MGYPTQKPLKLLDRIIKASSKPDDLILNPFCGCGTAVDAANRLGRRWAGIDISSFAIDLICGKRLKDRTIPVKGIPFRSRAASEAVANTGRIRVGRLSLPADTALADLRLFRRTVASHADHG